MGMDLNFVALSKDKEQLTALKDYINELYERDYDTEDHKMLGYEMSLLPVNGYHVLCGCHRKCFGWDLGYWCKKEDKNHLLEGVLYFEERQDEDTIKQYFPGDYLDEEGLLSNVEDFANQDTGEILNENSGVPTELHLLVINIIRYGISKRISTLHKLAYEKPTLLAIRIPPNGAEIFEAIVDGNWYLLRMTETVSKIIKENSSKKVLFVLMHTSGGFYSDRPAVEYFRFHVRYDVLSKKEFLSKCKDYGVYTNNMLVNL